MLNTVCGDHKENSRELSRHKMRSMQKGYKIIYRDIMILSKPYKMDIFQSEEAQVTRELLPLLEKANWLSLNI